MDLCTNNLSKTKKIYFTQSVEEMLENQTAQTIKSILLQAESGQYDDEFMRRFRKVVLDNINDLSRLSKSIIESLVEFNGIANKNRQDGV